MMTGEQIVMTSLINVIAHSASIFGRKSCQTQVIGDIFTHFQTKNSFHTDTVFIRYNLYQIIQTNLYRIIYVYIITAFFGLKLGSTNLLGHNSLLIATC